jgi:dihydrofolate reductase
MPIETPRAPPGRPVITLVVAVADNGVIGVDNALPWRLPDDLKRFKSLTMGKPIVMGRRTWLSLGRPLPGRENVVLTRDAGFAGTAAALGATVVHSLDEALERFAGAAEIAVIGGAEVYRAALPIADRIERTLVHAEVAGDTFFSELDPTRWRLVASEHRAADERHALPFSFETLVRVY